MFKLTHELPKSCWVAVSGGIDSMVALHWLAKTGRVNGVIHVNYKTSKFSDEAEQLVRRVAHYTKGCQNVWCTTVPYGTPANEEAWRDFRYNFFSKVPDTHIVTAHNMNDCLEEYITCTMKRGYVGTIPYRRGNVIRPFRQWTRDQICEYAEYHQVEFLEDPSNENTDFDRNLIRHEVVPHLLKINPGIWNIVSQAIITQDKWDSKS